MMTSAKLDNLVKIGKLKKEAVRQAGFEGLQNPLQRKPGGIFSSLVGS